MKRIVVVEDDPWLGEHYTRTLSRANFKVHTTQSGEQAIDVIDEVKPDVMIFDALLFGTTAAALLHELQSHHDLASIPIIMVTNIADRFDEMHMKKFGVHRIFDKATLNPHELIEQIRAIA